MGNLWNSIPTFSSAAESGKWFASLEILVDGHAKIVQLWDGWFALGDNQKSTNQIDAKWYGYQCVSRSRLVPHSVFSLDHAFYIFCLSLGGPIAYFSSTLPVVPRDKVAPILLATSSLNFLNQHPSSIPCWRMAQDHHQHMRQMWSTYRHVVWGLGMLRNLIHKFLPTPWSIKTQPNRLALHLRPSPVFCPGSKRVWTNSEPSPTPRSDLQSCGTSSWWSWSRAPVSAQCRFTSPKFQPAHTRWVR